MYHILLKPKTITILDHLLKEDVSLDELSSKMGFSKSNLKQKYMDQLEAIDIIEKSYVRTRTGRMVRYRLKPFTLFLSYASQGFALSFTSRTELDTDNVLLHQVDPVFKNDLDTLFKPLILHKELNGSVIILFGSVARGIGSEKSDVDLLFILGPDMKKEMVLDTISDISLSVGHSIDPVFMEKGEFLAGDSVLIKEIKEHGIILYGSPLKVAEVWRQMKRYRNIIL